MSVPNRILFAVVALGLLTVLLAQFEGWRVDRSQQQQLQANATDLKQLLRQFAVLPAILASDPRLSAALLPPNAESSTHLTDSANKLLRVATDRSDAAFAFLMDSTGLTVAASNFEHRLSFVGKNYGFRPYFTKAMGGSSATYFAVGATTGIAGYFVSEPIVQNGEILGVIAVKLEPQQLPVSWNTENNIALVTDELGVAILSTDQRLLYNRTKELSNNALRLIDEERRYSIARDTYLDTQNYNRWRWLSEQGNSFAAYRVGTIPIEVEPWSLSLLTPVRDIHVKVIRNLVVLLGVALLLGLLWHVYRQQVHLARERAKLTDRLEQLVQEKTQELESAQQALIAESNYAMLGKMSAAINHEINQPLASLRLNLATLRQLIENAEKSHRGSAENMQTTSNMHALEHYAGTDLEQDSVQSTVIDLDRTAKRIGRVIETLRALPQQNRSGFVPVDVYALIGESVSNLKADRKSLSRFLTVDLPSDEVPAPSVLGQPILLQQALLNILYNALDAVANVEKPFVELSVSLISEQVIMEVYDNGAGVSPSMESALFEPFESAPEKVSGMGIGLTLARQIINDHGGSLTYHRKSRPLHYAPDGLTVFVITLPMINTRSGLHP